MGIGLPVIVDIAISLVFTYFTLSLLASEVQNLLKTLLQWRAVHLKESIEGLLVGNDSSQATEARELANQIYANPLIRSLSHQTKGGPADAIRSPLRAVGKLVPKGDRVFGDQDGGPSKIPASTFSRSLLSTFDFVGIYRQIVAFRLETAIKSMVIDSDQCREQYQKLVAEEVTAVLASFKSNQTSLADTIKNLAEEVREDGDKGIFKKELFDRYFGSDEAVKSFSDKMQLSLADTIRSVRQYLQIQGEQFKELKQELGDHPTFDEAKAALERFREKHPELAEDLPPSTDQTFLALALILTNPTIQELVSKQFSSLPPALSKNLENLADKALGTIDNVAQEAAQFEQEISTWFDNSMVRAKGVYKRNSKLISIIIAFAVAITANADTFYMINRFSKEKTITASVVEMVDQLPQSDLQQSDQINQLSDQLALPVGWDESTLQLQQRVHIVPFGFIPFWLQRLPGWVVTGIAVSMGASFWYDLLKKLVDVGKAGDPVPEKAPAAARPKPSTSS